MPVFVRFGEVVEVVKVRVGGGAGIRLNSDLGTAKIWDCFRDADIHTS